MTMTNYVYTVHFRRSPRLYGTVCIS